VQLSEWLECAASFGFGSSGDVSLGREMFGDIAGIVCANAVTPCTVQSRRGEGILLDFEV
jgi:hypothetical protein